MLHAGGGNARHKVALQGVAQGVRSLRSIGCHTSEGIDPRLVYDAPLLMEHCLRYRVAAGNLRVHVLFAHAQHVRQAAERVNQLPVGGKLPGATTGERHDKHAKTQPTRPKAGHSARAVATHSLAQVCKRST